MGVYRMAPAFQRPKRHALHANMLLPHLLSCVQLAPVVMEVVMQEVVPRSKPKVQ